MILVVSPTHYITVTLLLTGMAGPCTAGLHPAMVSIYCAGLKQYYGCRGNIVGWCDGIVVNNYQGTITRHNEQA